MTKFLGTTVIVMFLQAATILGVSYLFGTGWLDIVKVGINIILNLL